LTEEQLKAAGVNPGLIRISAGLEHIDDILEDIRQAMAKV
jgi:O-acetylhomoserine (thiol)-lyase